MKKYQLILLLILMLAYIAACAPTQPAQQPVTAPKTIPKTEPKVEVNQPVEEPVSVQQGISSEVNELLNKSKVRVKSIYYKYRGPETGSNFYEFYIKGNKIRYKPYLEIKTLDTPDSYDAVFIDKAANTAVSYCEAAYCAYKGKKADLSYEDAYIPTVFDWVSGITEAKKIGEEVINDRSTWKVEANNGIMWIDTFYGIPLKVQSGEKTYQFEQIAVNSVQDSDVAPSQ